MDKYHLHMPGWMHVHKPDWYRWEARFEHLIHDPRFWAALGLGILLILMILTSIFAKPGNAPTNPALPPYPYMLP